MNLGNVNNKTPPVHNLLRFARTIPIEVIFIRAINLQEKVSTVKMSKWPHQLYQKDM